MSSISLSTVLLLLLSCLIVNSYCSYEIWSIYFDTTHAFLPKTNLPYLKEQIFENPFNHQTGSERYIVQISTFMNESTSVNIVSMQLKFCNPILENDNHSIRILSGTRLFSNGQEYSCLQLIASQTSPITSNQNHSMITWPEEVALMLKKSSAILLSIQYDQDYELLQDNSGFDLFLTEEKPQFESGIMAVGLSPDERFLIPANMSSWQTRGTCLSTCFGDLMPMNEMRIIGVFTTIQHVSLQESSLEIVSKDIKQKIFQHGGDISVDLSQEAIVNFENNLQINCEYKSYNSTLLGGFSETNENCLVWIHYYPKMELESCLSAYSIGTLGGLLDVDELTATIGGGDSSQMLNVTVGSMPIGDYVSQKDINHQWNSTKLNRSRFSVLHGRQPAQCGWQWNLSFLDNNSMSLSLT